MTFDGQVCLTLIEKLTSGKRAKGLFLCACGNRKVLNVDNVRPRKTVSCGCYLSSFMTGLGKASATHGATGTVEHTAYIQARSRCSDSNRRDYRRYGGRGIRFCYMSFEQFIADVGLKQDSTLSLDRINNDGNYEPGNCRWATPKQQRNNQRA